MVVTSESKRRPFRVLSMDGGTSPSQNLRMLKYVAESLEEAGLPGLLASTDLFVGNSAGAIAAMYLSFQLGTNKAASEVEIFDDCIAFFDKLVIDANGGIEAIGRLVWGKQAAIDNDALLALLQGAFGDTAYELLETPVCATSFDMREPAHPETKCSAALTERDRGMTIIDAGMQSGAFPLLYPLYQSHIDGAFVSNNPSMLGIARVVELARSGHPYFDGVQLDDIVLFSLGTDSPQFTAGTFPADDESWGWRKWLGPHFQSWEEKSLEEIQEDVKENFALDGFNMETMLAVSALLYGNSQGVRSQCRQLLPPGQFFRLALPGRKSIGELMMVIIVGLGFLIKPMASLYAHDWKKGKVHTDAYDPSIEDTVTWLESAWLNTEDGEEQSS